MNSPRWWEPRIEESLKSGEKQKEKKQEQEQEQEQEKEKEKEKEAPGEVVKVVHNDGDKQIEHDEGAEEDEGHKVDVGSVGAARLVGVDEEPGGIVPLIGPLVTGPARQPSKHDVWPGLARGAPGTKLRLILFQILCQILSGVVVMTIKIWVQYSSNMFSPSWP